MNVPIVVSGSWRNGGIAVAQEIAETQLNERAAAEEMPAGEGAITEENGTKWGASANPTVEEGTSAGKTGKKGIKDESAAKAQKQERKALISALLATFLWASAFAGIRAGLEGYGPLELALLRFSFASLLFVIYALATRMEMPRREDLPRIFILGLTGITIYHCAINIGEVTVTAGTASLIISTSPVFTTIMAKYMLKEEFRPIGWVGFLLSLIGVCLMALNGDGGLKISSGALLILLASISTAFYMVYQKPLFSRYKPIATMAYITWAGTIPMLVFIPGLLKQMAVAPPASTLSALYIGAFPGAIAYAAWSVANEIYPSSTLSSFLYLSPPLAILIGYLWLGEIPTGGQILGGVIALIGVYIVNKWAKIKR